MHRSPIIQSGILATLILLAAWPCEIAWAQIQVMISASKDNTLYEHPNGALSNGAGEHLFAGRTNIFGGGLIRRGLIAFDIGGSVPPDASITAVSLTLVMSRTSIASGPQSVSLHRLLADWGEGTSDAFGNEGGGAPSTTNDATWIHRFFPDTTTLWTNPGGDFDATASASQIVGDSGVFTWGSTGQMVGDVQSWLDNPSSNFGWLVRGVEESALTAKRFDSRQIINPDARPVLTVTYTPLMGAGEHILRPENFILHQNTPNPFNPITTIRYDLPHETHVSLHIYNALGQKVRTLIDQTQAAGVWMISWDGRDQDGGMLGSGMYFYRTEAGEQVRTRKMILLK